MTPPSATGLARRLTAGRRRQALAADAKPPSTPGQALAPSWLGNVGIDGGRPGCVREVIGMSMPGDWMSALYEHVTNGEIGMRAGPATRDFTAHPGLIGDNRHLYLALRGRVACSPEGITVSTSRRSRLARHRPDQDLRPELGHFRQVIARNRHFRQPYGDFPSVGVHLPSAAMTSPTFPPS